MYELVKSAGSSPKTLHLLPHLVEYEAPLTTDTFDSLSRALESAGNDETVCAVLNAFISPDHPHNWECMIACKSYISTRGGLPLVHPAGCCQPMPDDPSDEPAVRCNCMWEDIFYDLFRVLMKRRVPWDNKVLNVITRHLARLSR